MGYKTCTIISFKHHAHVVLQDVCLEGEGFVNFP